MKLTLVLFATSFFLASAELVDQGIYSLAFNGGGACKSRYLSFEKYSNSKPARVSLGSPVAKSPALWRLRSLGNKEYTFEAVNRGKASLSYQAACTSKSVQLDTAGRLRWKLTAVDQKKGIYRVSAASRSNCTSGVARLGPIAGNKATKCDYPNNSIKLFPVQWATNSLTWKFTLVSKPSANISPSPAPVSTPVLVSTYVVSLDNGKQCTALSLANLQSIADTICAGQINYIVSEGWNRQQVACTGTAKCVEGARHARTLLQDGNVFVETETTLLVENAQQAQLSITVIEDLKTVQQNNETALFNSTAIGGTVETKNTTSTQVTPTATEPSAPQSVTVSVSGNCTFQASLSWQAPASNGGAAISRYDVSCTVDGSTLTASTTGTSAVLGPIAASKTGSCSVIAINAVALSSPSASAAFTTPALPAICSTPTPPSPPPPTVPGAPAAVNVAFPVNGDCTQSVQVFWVPPNTDGGSPITGYEVTCTGSGATLTTGSNLVTGTSVVLDGATLNRTYVCAVKSSNVVGFGTAASSASFYTELNPACFPTVPTEPQSMTVTFPPSGTCDSSLKVSWSAPASDGYRAITGYNVSCTSSDGGSTLSSGATLVTDLSTVLDNATLGKTYNCSVKAYNRIGDGPAGTSASITTNLPARCLANKPTAVTTDLLISDHQSWKVTWNDGAAVDLQEKYYLKCVTDNDCASTTGKVESSAINRGTKVGTLTGLIRDTNYYCFVIARNLAGDTCSDAVEYKTMACACDTSVPSGSGFDSPTFTAGASILGKGGWVVESGTSKNQQCTAYISGSAWDERIIDGGDSHLYWRISDAVVKTSYSDMPHSPMMAKPAGETGATATVAGTAVTAQSKCFCGSFSMKSFTGAAQPGLRIVIEPAARGSTKGSSSRLFGWIFMDNNAGGFDVTFENDAKVENTTGPTYASTVTSLAYDSWHRVTMMIEFVDGLSNDIVKLYVDGNPIGANLGSYEFIYTTPMPANSLQFRVFQDYALFDYTCTSRIHDRHPAYSGKGFLFDKVVVDNGISFT